MPNRRKKWSRKEDQDILAVLEACDSSTKTNWVEVRDRFNALGNSRSSTQIKERYTQHLLCKPKKAKTFAPEDVRRIFDLHITLNGRWKEIATLFSGASDLIIKNIFYTKIKAAIRRAAKFASQTFSFDFAKTIKPKMLSEFNKKLIYVDKDVHCRVESMPWTHSEVIKVSEFLKFFVDKKSEPVARGSGVGRLIDCILENLEVKIVPPRAMLKRNSTK